MKKAINGAITIIQKILQRIIKVDRIKTNIRLKIGAIRMKQLPPGIEAD
jgi:hypothetical protein